MEYPLLSPWLSDPNRRPLVMGVLNVTPDSFSDGGAYIDPNTALDRAQAMVAEGADWIDLGAESTRPGAQRTPDREQLRRLDPILRDLRKRVGVVLSIDTTRSAVAAAALDAGVDVVNDISGGQDDEHLLPLVARRGAAIILTHMLGQPATMQNAPTYRDVTTEVGQFLRERALAATEAGCDRARILIDPGIGFGKTAEHNLQLLRDLSTLAAQGFPLVVGTSRKGFIGKITGETARSGRAFGTAATVAWAIANGVAVVRVHDVKAMAQVVRMIRAIQIGTP